MNATGKRRALPVVGLLAAAALLVGLLPASAGAAIEHYEGPVLSKNGQKNTFAIDDQHTGKVKFKVTAQTQFEGLSGFSALKQGKRVEVRAKTGGKKLKALKVEDANRGGGGGGNDDGSDHQ